MVKSQALRSRGDRQLDPRGWEASSLRGTRAPTRPPRPRRRCGGDPAGPAAPSESLFSRCDSRGRDPGNQAGPRPRGREPSSPRPGPARRRLPFPPGPQETSRHRGGEPATVVTARRPVSPGLAHAALTDDEDLQGGQHVLVHPDPAPHREQPAAPSAPQPFPPSSFIKRKKLIFLTD